MKFNYLKFDDDRNNGTIDVCIETKDSFKHVFSLTHVDNHSK